MKTSNIYNLTLIAAVVMLTSCSNVVFETVQPTHEKELVSTTDELQGTWIGEGGEGLKISSRRIKTPDMKYMLGTDCKLKASNGRYFLSFPEDDAWMLIIAEVKGDKMVVWQFDVQTEEEFAELQKITSVILINEDSDYDAKALLNPSHEEFERMLDSDLKEELGVFVRK